LNKLENEIVIYSKCQGKEKNVLNQNVKNGLEVNPTNVLNTEVGNDALNQGAPKVL
jgi:hypothetical protein